MRRVVVLTVVALFLLGCSGSEEPVATESSPSIKMDGDVHPAKATEEMFERLPNQGQSCSEESAKALNKEDPSPEAMLICTKTEDGSLRWRR